MHRRFTSLVKSSHSPSNAPAPGAVVYGDSESQVATVVRDDEALPTLSLKVKRVDYYYSRWGKTWKYRNMSSKVVIETVPLLQSGSNDPWKDFSFVLVRRIPREEHQEPTFKIIVKSGYILKACQDVVKTWPGISWHNDPLELDPEMFITFFDAFIEYRDNLAAQKERTDRESHIMSSVNLLLSTISIDYKATLTTIDRLKAHGEITFELLYAILVPRTVFIATCAVTEKPRLFQLVSFMRTSVDAKPVYQLFCESIDLIDMSSQQKATVSRVQTTILLPYFKGMVKIQDLDAYPLRYHPQAETLRGALLRRGKKWVSMIGVHHMQYNGIAGVKTMDKFSGCHRLSKHNVNGRIMVDRATFRRLNPNYLFPTASINPTNAPQAYPLPLPMPAQSSDSLVSPRGRNRDQPNPWAMQQPQFLPQMAMNPPHPSGPYVVPWQSPFGNGDLVRSTANNGDSGSTDLTDDELILTTPVVYGFSLSDKIWLEFDVEEVQPVEWNEDAFTNLVLPSDRKDLLRSLVEAHHRGIGFDDFIKGKGHGLVVNLFGPPGVGKTFSAEATSEHVQRPLYVVGGGDLGTRAGELDAALERIFDVATAWKAIVLIDEADVFLEQRSLHDLERNAMVAVFLRHVEYYRGILFLTTNRVQAFDEAFLSRIHVALHFNELTQASKEQIWIAFIGKLGALDVITPEQIKELATRNVNGRQIKNAARTAQSLAVGRGEAIEFRHFLETLDAMAEFTKVFEVLRRRV